MGRLKILFVAAVIALFILPNIFAEDLILKEKKAEIKGVIKQALLEKIQQFPDKMQRVILTFHKKPEGYKNFINSLGGRITHDYDIIEGIAISLPAKLIEKLLELENLVSIQEDRVVHAFLSESIPLINADDVWGLGYNGSGKTVCVVDSGVDYNHPALTGKVIAQKCYCSGSSGPKGCCPGKTEVGDDAMDDNGHGTHVAGIIASQDSTYKGVAPGADLMAVKVLDSSGSGWESDVIEGINWCSAQNADIISISLGSGLFSSYCDGEADAQAVNNAVDAGAVVSIASGNDGSTTAISAPACASKAISVGDVYDADVGGIGWSVCTDSTTYADKIVCHSNRNEILDLLAPGALIMSTVLNNEFDEYGGTSMAAPHVSGAAALLLEANSSLTPAEIEAILEGTGVDIYDSGSGLTFPRIDVLAAIGLPTIGHLEPYLIDPTSDKNVTQNEFFTFSSGVKCVGGECGNVSATLKLYFESYPTTCSGIWGFDCGTGPPETGGDNTFDSCGNGAGDDESINEVYLDKNKVGFGEEIEVKCYFVAKALSCSSYYTSDDLYIYYRNSSSSQWVQKYARTSNVYNCQNYSVTFIPDSIEGEHQVRCIVDYNPENDECAGGSWYDNDDANFTVIDNKISINIGDTPFYTTSDNPQTCYNMQTGDTCNQTWQVNATGDVNTTWEFFTIYDSITYDQYIESNKTEKINITIVEEALPTEFISITLIGYPIDFGNLDPGTSDNNATGNSGGYNISIGPETTVNVDLYQKGDDFIYDSYILGIGNMIWSTTNDAGTSLSMNSTYDSNYPIATNIPPDTNTILYYWLDLPTGQRAGGYTSTIYIKAVETKTLEVHYINVSQGDAEFIISPDGYTLLIDSGRYDSYGDDVVAYIQSLGYNKIDYVMASHMHADHLGGLDKVVNALNPDICYDHGGSYSSIQYDQYNSACSGKRQTLSQGNYINLGASVTAEILQAGYSSDENTKSVVMELSYGNLDLIFGGDCTDSCEATLSPGDLEVYKVHHHGSKYSSTQSFLDIILPEVSIIEVGPNSYGHPTPETLGRLTAIGSDIFRTDQDGTVILTCSDGTNYNVAGNNYVAS